MEQFLSVLTGIVLTLLVVKLVNWWSQIKLKEKREQSLKVLHEHGLDTRLYLGTVGTDNEELRNAIDDFTCSGYIILDRDNNVVGRLIPKIKSKPALRLIVSNDN